MNFWKIIDFAQRLVVEFVFLAGILLLSLLPFWQKIGAAPNFLSVVIYLWAVYRPDLMSMRLFIILGICRDALLSYPLGVSVLQFILLITLTQALRKYVLDRSFWIVFCGYALFTLVNNFAFWGILSLTKGHFLPLTGALSPILIDFLAYPLMCQVSLAMQHKLDNLRQKELR